MNGANKYRTVVVATDSFPYGGITEEAFVMPGLKELSTRVERVIVMPTIAVGPKAEVALPSNVVVEDAWLKHRPWSCKLLRAWRGLQPSVWRSGIHSYTDLTFAIASHEYAFFIQNWIKREHIDLNTTLFEAFWFDLSAAGLAIASRRMPINFMVRAHGHDIYRGTCMPLRAEIADRCQGIFSAGDSGRDYLRWELPKYADKIITARLGSIKKSYEYRNQGHIKSDCCITLLSVARVSWEKRVDLNFDLIRQLALARPSMSVKWIHVGDGPLMTRLREYISAIGVPDNLTVELRGALSNKDVHELYFSEKIDWTILLSRGEGLPITVCESLSYGVPVIATMVRGCDEAVDDSCGLLLAEEPTPEEFVRGIITYLDSDMRMSDMRANAFDRWCEMFDAKALRAEFMNKILN